MDDTVRGSTSLNNIPFAQQIKHHKEVHSRAEKTSSTAQKQPAFPAIAEVSSATPPPHAHITPIPPHYSQSPTTAEKTSSTAQKQPAFPRHSGSFFRYATATPSHYSHTLPYSQSPTTAEENFLYCP